VTVALVALVVAAAARPAAIPSAPFGEVPLTWPAGQPRRVVILLEGDGGWEPRVRDLATALAADGALVLGVDTKRYLERSRAGRCVYAAGDLEVLAQSSEKALGFTAYLSPVLVGYSSGATLAYAALAQAPSGTFQGAVSIGFCSDLLTATSLCAGEGLRRERRGRAREAISPSPVRAPWKLYSGTEDRSCRLGDASAFAARVPGAEVIPVAGAGHGYGNMSTWTGGLRRDVVAMTEPPAPSAPSAPPTPVSDLPLTEVPATEGGELLAILLTGDGGWASIDRAIAGRLASAGIGVVGLDSLRYFWSRKTPEQLGADVRRIALHYTTAWRRSGVILVGYSRGADVVPVAVEHLGRDVADRLRLVALIGPGLDAELEVHVTDLFSKSTRGTPILPAAQAIRAPVLCVYGSEEVASSVCPSLGGRSDTHVVELPGGHHFDGDYDAVGRLILESSR
jgi:type IV secretory pathway VirJ component